MSLCIMASQKSTCSGITGYGILENNTLIFNPFFMYCSHWLSSLRLEKQLWYSSWQTRLKSPEIFVTFTDFGGLKLTYLSLQLKLPAFCWSFEDYFIVPIIFKWKCSHFLQITLFHASYSLWHIFLRSW